MRGTLTLAVVMVGAMACAQQPVPPPPFVGPLPSAFDQREDTERFAVHPDAAAEAERYLDRMARYGLRVCRDS